MSDAIVFAEQLEKRRLTKEAIDAEIKTASERLKDILAQSKKALSDMETATGESLRLDGVLTALRTQIDDAQSEFESVSTLVRDYNKQLTQSKAELAQVSQLVKTHSAITADLPEIQEKHTTLIQEVSLLEAQRDALVLDKNSVSNRYEQLKNELTAIQASVPALKKEAATILTLARAEYQATHDKCKKMVEEAEEKVKAFEMERNVPTALIRHLENKLQEKHVRFNVLEAVSDYKGLIHR